MSKPGSKTDTFEGVSTDDLMALLDAKTPHWQTNSSGYGSPERYCTGNIYLDPTKQTHPDAKVHGETTSSLSFGSFDVNDRFTNVRDVLEAMVLATRQITKVEA